MNHRKHKNDVRQNLSGLKNDNQKIKSLHLVFLLYYDFQRFITNFLKTYSNLRISRTIRRDSGQYFETLF